MVRDEARELGESIDFVLRNDARGPEERRRLEEMRRDVQHVEDTGAWPGAGAGRDEGRR